jgi:putative flippase GtrA
MTNTMIQNLKRFLLVGGSGFCVDAALTFLFIQYGGLWPLWARVLSFACVIPYTWWLNRTFTFHQDTPPCLKEFLKYLGTCAIAALINLGVYSAVIVIMGQDNGYILLGIVLGTGTGLMVNFVSMHLLVFQRRRASGR